MVMVIYGLLVGDMLPIHVWKWIKDTLPRGLLNYGRISNYLAEITCFRNRPSHYLLSSSYEAYFQGPSNSMPGLI